MAKRTIEDVRPEIVHEMKEFEVRTDLASKMFDKCDITNNEFIDNMGKIGGLYYKYTKIAYLPTGSDYGKRFDAALNKFGNSRSNFIKNCSCKKK